MSAGEQGALKSAMEDFLDQLYDIELDFDLDHFDWLAHIRSWCGSTIANGYQEWWGDRQ